MSFHISLSSRSSFTFHCSYLLCSRRYSRCVFIIYELRHDNTIYRISCRARISIEFPLHTATCVSQQNLIQPSSSSWPSSIDFAANVLPDFEIESLNWWSNIVILAIATLSAFIINLRCTFVYIWWDFFLFFSTVSCIATWSFRSNAKFKFESSDMT